MKSTLSLYNTLSRRKERFEPLEPPFVGLYVAVPPFTAIRIWDMRVRPLRSTCCFAI